VIAASIIPGENPIARRATAPKVISRRLFLQWSAAAGAGAVLGGCATNPVTGKSQFLLISEADEISMDREVAPHQFSTDFGPSQDASLNAYIASVGSSLADLTHRPHMPYSYRAVNAVHVNAYTFPAGSMAVTRGILLAMESEAELAAVLGHELGHVNARHGAERMSKSLLANALVAGTALYLQSEHEEYAPLAVALGGLGSTLLLAHYSRDNERQADALGLEYMTRAGYSPQGMVDLMEMLVGLHDREPHVLEAMFSTHPMSRERYRTAVEAARAAPAAQATTSLNRQRYMDRTASLRAIAPAIESLQKGNQAMADGQPERALTLYRQALKIAPDDYGGLLLTANCLSALNRDEEAKRYVEAARAAYPHEAQAAQSMGLIELRRRNFEAAHQQFEAYQILLPGNPTISALDGLALDGMGRRREAAAEYAAYLREVQQGELAAHAYNRLVEWGYIQPAAH
jgi:predicted Zn-dependent protease